MSRRQRRIEIFKDSKNEFRFRFVAANNKIVAVSEGYKKKRACYKGIKSVILISSSSSPIFELIDSKNGNRLS